MFLGILSIGISLVVVQGLSAYHDGYFSQKQMRRGGIRNGYSFLEHGGMWADVFVISPLVAYITSTYSLPFYTGGSLMALVAITIVLMVMGTWFSKMGETTPEAHTHDGHTTAAGWIHGFFALVGVWVCVLFYLFPTTPKVTTHDLLIVSIVLTFFFPLGMAKFNRRWRFGRNEVIIFAVELAVVWTITVVKIRYI